MSGRKTKLAVTTLGSGLLILGIYSWTARGVAGLPKSDHFCEVGTLAKPTLGDARFQIVDVACDTLAKDETLRVYALGPRTGLFGGARDEATLLFSFDPIGSQEDGLPKLRANPDGTIIISIPEVSSISYKGNLWRGKPVLYEIGKIDYPQP